MPHIFTLHIYLIFYVMSFFLLVLDLVIRLYQKEKVFYNQIKNIHFF